MAMRLYCPFGCPQRKSDLLVDPAPHNKLKHLPFARRQRGDAVAQGVELFPLVEQHLLMGERFFDRMEQILGRYRFSQEVFRSGLDGSNGHWNVAVTGQKD